MEKNKMKQCKTCGAEIAKSAKTCPQCGGKIKKGHPVLTGIAIFMIVAAVLGSTDGDEPGKVEGAVSSQNSGTVSAVQETEKTEFYVGEAAELRGITVTLASVTESAGSAYNKPTDGNEFVLCEFEIENNSNKEISISSMISFEAYCDDYTCNFSLGALLEKGNKNQLDGTVAPGKRFNGVVGYEVPVDWSNLEIVFTPDFWSGKDITFVAVND